MSGTVDEIEQETRPPFTREAWLLVGQDLLRTEGFTGVKLAALTAAAGATTGSFYHHFRDIRDYHDGLAAYYGGEQIEAALASLRGLGPRQRLQRFAFLARERNMTPLDSAMRIWAASFAPAKQAVRQTDHRLLEFCQDAFVELGFAGDGARLRARMLFALGVAHIYAPWRAGDGDVDDTLDILTQPARP